MRRAVRLSRARSLLLLRQQQRGDFQRALRPAQPIALHFGAALRAQDVELFLGLDTLRRRGLSQADGKADHGTRDQTLLGASVTGVAYAVD